MKPMSDRLPEGWSRKRIDDLGQLYSGATPSTHIDSYWGDEIVWVTPNDLSTLRTRHIEESERRITPLGLQNCSAHLLPRGSLIISSRAPIGYLAIAQTEFCTNQGCKSLVFSSDHDPDFHYYNLSFRVRTIREKGEGTTFAEISKTALASIEVPVPNDKAEQTAIAGILATVDQAIEQTEALIAKQRRIKAGLLHDLLTRGIDEHGQLRDPATHRFKESPVGLVPEEWEVRTVDRVARQVTDGDHHTPKRSDSGVFLLSARNVLDGELDLSDVDFVSEDEYQRMIKRCFPEAGDVLISCSGTIGRVCLVPAGFRCGLVRSVALTKFDHAQCLPDYGSWAMRSHFVRKQIAASQLQAAQPNLFQGAIRGIHIALPELQEQQVIASILDSADDFIASGEAQKLKLVRLKDGLMHGLLSGRVSVAGLIAEKNMFPYGDPTHNPKDNL